MVLNGVNIVMASSPAAPPDTIPADPGLLPLADNGGPTLTHALQPDSPALDMGVALANID